MLETVPMAPPDPILGLNEAFQSDRNLKKVNLTIGVFQDAEGKTPILECVRLAEERVLTRQTSKSYLGIQGNVEFGRLVQELLFGEGHEVVTGGLAATVQTPGGTGALRVAADFVKKLFPDTTVWCSKPTWPNHKSVFAAACLPVRSYPYFDPANNGLDFEAMLASLGQIPAGDVVCLHACCHNPSGVDPTQSQWRQIAEVIGLRGLLPLLDFAYHGFGRGLREDAEALSELSRSGGEMMVCSSYSKNFGIYNERVGALSVVAATAQQAGAAMSQLKACVRANYSNPPAHGAAIVATILFDEALRRRWHEELGQMCDRIKTTRQLFVDAMKDRVPDRDFSFISRQRGMFSFSGLTPDQVQQLRTKYSIYIVGSGRINVASLTEKNIDYVSQSIAEVL